MKAIIMSAFCAFFVEVCMGQHSDFDYFGMTVPEDSSELFAPGIVSLSSSQETCLAISPKGDEVFFAAGETWPQCKIMHVRKIGTRWTKPEVAEFSGDRYAAEPAFSPDGHYLYYSSFKEDHDIRNCCIWRVEKIGTKWMNPQKVIDVADSLVWEFHPSITKEGMVYFCCWDSRKNEGSLYQSRYSKGLYSDPEKVNISLSTQSSVTNPFVDPEEKYLITSCATDAPKSGYDVFVSYKKREGPWSDPVIFDNRLNTPEDDNSFDVSPDGRFLFIYRDNDVYWIKNQLPYLTSF